MHCVEPADVALAADGAGVIFLRSFVRVLVSSAGGLRANHAGTLVDAPMRAHMDFDANAKDLSCYLVSALCDSEAEGRHGRSGTKAATRARLAA